jgi:hypothetical protein
VISGSKPAEIKFYLDADILGLAKILVQMRPDMTYPGYQGDKTPLHRRVRPPCPIIDPGTPDTQWIPEVARQGWLALTRDSKIQDRLAEIESVRISGCRLVAFTGSDARTPWDQLEVLMCQWRGITALLDEDGPLVYAATRTSLRPIKLDPQADEP